MPISGTRRMMTRNILSGNIDIKDPSLVLYTPLWYPDSETTISPITSKDINRHSCTVTGATWSNQGYVFAGGTDVINAGSDTVLDNLTGNLTIMGWLYPTSIGGGGFGRFFDKGLNFYCYFSSEYDLSFAITIGGVSKAAASTGDALSLNNWHFVACVYNGTNVLMYVDNTLFTGTAATGAIDSHAASSLLIGNSAAGTRSWVSTIGEVLIYNRALSAGEIKDKYQDTKWRYL